MLQELLVHVGCPCHSRLGRLLPSPPHCAQLEAAKVETELPPGMAGVAHLKGSHHFITITVHSSFAFSCDHPFYVLAAPSQEVQMAWVNACWQVGGRRVLGGQLQGGLFGV